MRMSPHQPTGWNTWDYRGFNRLVYLQAGKTRLSIQYAFWDESYRPEDPASRQLGVLHRDLRWEHARQIGPHAPLGLPASLEVEVAGTVFRVEAASAGKRLELSVTPTTPTALRVVFLLLAPDGEHLTPRDGGVRFAGWEFSFTGATLPNSYFLNLDVPYAVAPPGEAARLTVHPAGKTEQPATDDAATYAQTALSGGGALADAPQAMMRAVNWNTHYDTRRRLVSSPVSRDWCIDWRGPIIFGWDSFFAALMAASESRELGRANVEAVLAGVDELGFVPNYFMAHGAASRDRSMPCLGAYVVWKIEQADPDPAWLGKMYPRLTRWHSFWMKHRNGQGDGLLSWGSNAEPAYEFPQLLPYNPSLQHTAKCAMYEAGLDNSPMYDNVAFNRESCTFELADVILNAYYAMDCEALAKIAAALGRERDAQRYAREHASHCRLMNEKLWDERDGVYKNRHWDGRLSDRLSPGSFFPLAAGVADERQARRLIEEHLLNDREFWGAYVIPSIARNDPAYAENDYWRGRIWGPFNLLVAEGLRRYRFDAEATEFARRGLDIFIRNWQKDGGVYENYNAETGAGADVWNAARLYHWGGLLAYIGIQELIDSEPAGFLRFGSQHLGAAEVVNFQIAGRRFTVRQGENLTVERDGIRWLTCSKPATIRLPLADATAPWRVAADATGELIVQREPQTERPLLLADGRTIAAQIDGDRLRYTW